MPDWVREARWADLVKAYRLPPDMDRLEAEALAIGMEAHAAMLRERSGQWYSQEDD